MASFMKFVVISFLANICMQPVYSRDNKKTYVGWDGGQVDRSWGQSIPEESIVGRQIDKSLDRVSGNVKHGHWPGGLGGIVGIGTDGSEEEISHSTSNLITNLVQTFSKLLADLVMKNAGKGKTQKKGQQQPGYLEHQTQTNEYVDHNNRELENVIAFLVKSKVFENIFNNKDGLNKLDRLGDFLHMFSEAIKLTNENKDTTAQTDSLVCNGTYLIREKKREFRLNSANQLCHYTFLGSITENCTTAIMCTGKLKDGNSSTSCSDENDFFEISDGTVGKERLCGSSEFDNIPKTARNNGSDLFVAYQALSESAICAVSCVKYLTRFDVRPLKPSPLERIIDNDCICGKRNNIKPQTRIVKGEDAAEFEFPWIAPIVPRNKTFNQSRISFCGASLINDQYALTAAHCMYENGTIRNAADIQLIFHSHVMDREFHPMDRLLYNYVLQDVPGYKKAKMTDADENSTRTNIEEIIVHPAYDNKSFDYDVAILKLENQIDLTKGDVLPICLPEVGDKILDFVNKPMTAAGWGKVYVNFVDKYKSQLKWVNGEITLLPVVDVYMSGSRTLQKWDNVPAWSENECADFSRKPGRYGTLRHFCAGGKGDRGTCNGDSGGPLIAKLEGGLENQYLLAGLVSAGPLYCILPDYPQVYTNVQEVVQWVYYNTRKGKFCDKHTMKESLGHHPDKEEGRRRRKGQGRGRDKEQGVGQGKGRGRSINPESFSSGEYLKRQPIPPEVLTFDNDPDEIECNGDYLMTEKGYLTFNLQSRQPCKLSFKGSVHENCTVSLICKGKLNNNDRLTSCDTDYLEIYDETDGKEKRCGSSTLDDTPKIARNNGTDLTVVYKASSKNALCLVFCMEDANQDEEAAKKRKGHCFPKIMT